MFLRLKDKVAIVTGGGQGIGKGIVERFAYEGAYVIIADINEEVGLQTAEELKQKELNVTFQQTDVSNENSVRHLVNEVIERFNKIDILINNAAMTYRKALHETSLEEWNQLIGTNLTGAFLCSKYIIPEMQKKESGSIINMVSIHAEKTITRFAAYASAKGALTALTRQMSLDYGKDNIRVNAIGPGSIDSPMLHDTFQDLDDPEASLNEMLDFNPMKRLGTVEDVADVSLFLASDEAKYVNGQTIYLEGGQMNKYARPISFD